jgi:hypothetical protein
MRRNILRDAAEQQAGQSGTSMRADDDEIGSPFSRLVDDDCSRISLPDSGLD